MRSVTIYLPPGKRQRTAAVYQLTIRTARVNNACFRDLR